MIDWRRVLQEKRRFVAPLAIAALINVGVYLLVVYPLTGRTASLEARAQTATVSLTRAVNEFRAAEATRTGRARADEQLTRFYATVLPQDQAGARRITYPRLARLAEEANLDAGRRTFVPAEIRDSALEQLSGMSADLFLCDPHRIIVTGPRQLRGRPLDSRDLRSGMALIAAGLAAEGQSRLAPLETVERGYAQIVERLQGLGAHVTRL